MLRGSGVGARLDAGAIPFVTEVLELAGRGCVPGGSRANLEAVRSQVDFGGLAEAERQVLADAQTSGGLLAAVPESEAEALVAALARARTPERAVIGRIVAAAAGQAGHIAIDGRLTRAVTL